jgi:hypothetical protein
LVPPSLPLRASLPLATQQLRRALLELRPLRQALRPRALLQLRVPLRLQMLAATQSLKSQFRLQHLPMLPAQLQLGRLPEPPRLQLPQLKPQ